VDGGRRVSGALKTRDRRRSGLARARVRRTVAGAAPDARIEDEKGTTVACYALGDRVPAIDREAYVHPDAVVIGAVRLAAGASVWPGAVLRGDYGQISVGARTSIQDGTVVHCTEELATRIGADCVVGHLAHLEGCVVEDGSLIGSGAILLHHAVVHAGALVGAGALLTGGTEVPSRAMAIGVPARIREQAVDPAGFADKVDRYVTNAARYRAELRRVD
jgi:carbonic anhydrase/acetyltransferase-like protein (isoleucine patch superfamily)